MEGKHESPHRGLKGMLSRSRLGKEDKDRDRADSRSPHGDSSESGPEKFKARPSISGQGTGSENAQEAVRSKRKNKQQRREAEDDDGSGKGSANDVDAMTSESEGERVRPKSSSRKNAPPLIDHDSHTGYLTSSSPQIKAAPVNSSSRNALSNMTGDSTLSVDSAESGQSNRSRSISPGTKIKEALKSGSKKHSETNGSSKPGLFQGSQPSKQKKETLAARRQSKGKEEFVASPPPLETYNHARSQSNKSLPSITMTPETPPPLPDGIYDQMMASSYEKLPPLVTSPDSIKNQAADDQQPSRKSSSSDLVATKSNSSSITSFSSRRPRSDSQTTHPSKLSQSMNPPLTPMIEEVKTPPSSSSRNLSTSSGGFFTSVFSVAQNAASTLTNTLSNPVNRPRSAGSQHHPLEDEKKQEQQPEKSPDSQPEDPVQAGSDSQKPLAIDTIGAGELSLSHLGISTEASPNPGSSPAPSTPADALHSRSRSGTVVRREEAAAREEGISAARAVSAAYEDHIEDSPTPMVEDIPDGPKASTGEGSIVGDGTPNGSVADGETSSILRSNSLKKLNSRRRNRGGSQSTIGAALAASGTTLISNNASSQKLAGFAVASKKRNRDFHALFRSVPEDDYLIEDYSCALQRDIILAGRIYISEGHICFSSNILGWVTTLVISFDEVVSVEKESTAMVFPNAIAVQTLHARHTFRSLLSREATYDLLIGIWKINHPHLQSSENGVRVANGTGSKTEKLEGSHSENGSEGEGSEDNDVDGEDASEGSDDGQGSSLGSVEESAAAPDNSVSPPKSTIPKKASNIGLAASQATAPPTAPDVKAAAQANGAATAVGDFPGPPAHAPTECSDQSSHYPNMLKDEVIPAPLGKIYAMIFGNASGGFMSRWLLDEQKVLELQMDDDKKGLGEDNKTRSFTYIKPLSGSIVKQTKCIISEQLDSFDLEKAVSVTVTTQTPDVPSGNVFSTKTRYCLMWGPNNSTRIIMTCVIEWTGKSWLKGPIEKGANEGQSSYANDLCKALRAAVSKGKPAGSTPGKKKSKKKRAEGEKSSTSLATSAENKKSDWGMLEPLHGILGPVVDLLGPVLNVHALVALLSVLLLYSWLIRGGSVSSSLPPRTGRAARMAAYEELWRSEEAALWKWLEQRTGGHEGLVVPMGAGSRDRPNADRSKLAQHERQQALRGARGQSMSEQEVQRAVEITEEKLKGLKEAVKRAKVSVTAGESAQNVGEL